MDEADHQQLSGAVGDELRAAREASGLGLVDVAQRTRIPQRHLIAIEASDYPNLPAATYSAGFVRTYARLVGLDAHALSQRFRAEIAANDPRQPRHQEMYEPADPARVPSRGLVWVTLLIAVLVGLGYLYWRGSQLENPAEVASAPSAQPAAPPASSPAPQPAPVQAASSPAPVAAPTDTALITAEGPAWLRITDADGTKLFQGVLNTGDHFQVPATATDPRLRTSRATMLKVTVGSVTVPPLGPAETLIKDVSLKADALLARTQSPPAASLPAQ